MSKSKALAGASIIALAVLTAYQEAGESVAAQDASTWGKIFGVTFLMLGLLTWALALWLAHSKQRNGWAIAIFLVWPAMYLYIFWYDERS
jgi:hypothetical protein